MNEIPNCFYRVSVKALVLNETRDKFLVVQEENGRWELPGGGLDWGSVPKEDVQREIQEEMGLEVIRVADHPSYFVTSQNERGVWIANVLYEVELKNLDFTPSDECVAVKFIDAEDVKGMELFSNVEELLKVFGV